MSTKVIVATIRQGYKARVDTRVGLWATERTVIWGTVIEIDRIHRHVEPDSGSGSYVWLAVHGDDGKEYVELAKNCWIVS